MTPIQTQRERVLAEAVVSAYINELSPRERPAQRPVRERRELARAPRLGRVREQMRQRRELVAA
jgi:hypothetical protein